MNHMKKLNSRPVERFDGFPLQICQAVFPDRYGATDYDSYFQESPIRNILVFVVIGNGHAQIVATVSDNPNTLTPNDSFLPEFIPSNPRLPCNRVHVVYASPSGTSYKLLKEQRFMDLQKFDSVLCLGNYSMKWALFDLMALVCIPPFYTELFNDCLEYCKAFAEFLLRENGRWNDDWQQRLNQLSTGVISLEAISRTRGFIALSMRFFANHFYHHLPNLILMLVILLIYHFFFTK